MLKKLFLVLLVAAGGFAGYVATRPSTFKVARSNEIAAPAAALIDQVQDLKAWTAWNPWDQLDPEMKKTYGGPPVGKGAFYEWASSKESVGKGKMTIVDVVPGQKPGRR